MFYRARGACFAKNPSLDFIADQDWHQNEFEMDSNLVISTVIHVSKHFQDILHCTKRL